MGSRKIRTCCSAMALMGLLALSGCGKNLEFRNAEVSNGKIYAHGANEPFDGRVTNIPEQVIVPEHVAGPRAAFTSPFTAVGNVSGSFPPRLPADRVSDSAEPQAGDGNGPLNNQGGGDAP